MILVGHQPGLVGGTSGTSHGTLRWSVAISDLSTLINNQLEAKLMITSKLHSELVLALGLGLGLAIASGNLVRADQPAQPSQPSLASLAQARYDAATKLYDTAWSYYRQKAIETGFVFSSSLRLLLAELDLSDKRDNRIAAFEHHLCRMKKLQALVEKVQALGRSNTLEASQISLYRVEAEFWLAQAHSATESGKHHFGTGPLVDQLHPLPGEDS